MIVETTFTTGEVWIGPAAGLLASIAEFGMMGEIVSMSPASARDAARFPTYLIVVTYIDGNETVVSNTKSWPLAVEIASGESYDHACTRAYREDRHIARLDDVTVVDVRDASSGAILATFHVKPRSDVFARQISERGY